MAAGTNTVLHGDDRSVAFTIEEAFELVEQIGNFQTACRGVTRRVGLVAFEAEADQPFDPKLHHVAGNEQPFEGALVAETAASGFTLQGKLLRPALVRLKTVTAENEVAGELPLEPTESE